MSLKVFDITVDNKSHTYWSGCHNVSNCGEQTLPEDSSCNLLSINLLEHVLFGNRNSGVNVNKLDMSIKKAIDYLDKAIDIENYTDKLIEKKQKYL